MSDTLKQLQTQIVNDFVAGLHGLALSTEEAELVTRVVNRLATAAAWYPTAESAAQPRIKAEIDQDLSTLANIGVAKQINAQTLMRDTVSRAVEKFVVMGVKAALAAAVV